MKAGRQMADCHQRKQTNFIQDATDHSIHTTLLLVKNPTYSSISTPFTNALKILPPREEKWAWKTTTWSGRTPVWWWSNPNLRRVSLPRRLTGWNGHLWRWCMTLNSPFTTYPATLRPLMRLLLSPTFLLKAISRLVPSVVSVLLFDRLHFPTLLLDY